MGSVEDNCATPALTSSVQMTASGLVIAGDTPLQRLLGFLDAVLRGVGQVMLQNNSWTGLLFLVGIFYNSSLFGLAVVLGTSVSTLAAMMFAADRALVRAGMFGFNGALVATALMYSLQPELLTWGYVVFASACTAHSRRSNSFISGSRRTRTAVARNTALASAGAAVGMARKLAPVGGRSSRGTVMTSTALGSWAMLASG